MPLKPALFPIFPDFLVSIHLLSLVFISYFLTHHHPAWLSFIPSNNYLVITCPTASFFPVIFIPCHRDSFPRIVIELVSHVQLVS